MAMKKSPLSDPNKYKGLKAESARKKKEAQSMNMASLKRTRAVSAESKRKTAEAKSFPPNKKAPSSYALGLLPSQKKNKKKP